jgi:site-specific recombinase XerD
MKLSDALEGFLLFKAATVSANTVKEYRYSLNMWVEFLGDDPDVTAIESRQIQRFLYHLKVDRGLAPKTIKNAHTGLSAFFTWLDLQGRQLFFLSTP